MGISITKSELLSELYGRLPTFRERDCMDAAAVIIDSMSQTLVEGSRIEIRGFGSFGLKYRPERIGRNPQDGSAVAVRARYTVFFKAGKSLRERVDQSREN
ncbi:HU family DNA-binding protein [Sutterella sp.]|uniref:HU family DNA-binding protein n=1 Tax=Sutterella sp. TaxID=1981025 RepID=UPI0026E0F508|nr:HU family DNA-binding protein [Sutterella sp.]MDO5530588.1 HU family DNA-binding protein [Sutterella sp.]